MAAPSSGALVSPEDLTILQHDIKSLDTSSSGVGGSSNNCSLPVEADAKNGELPVLIDESAEKSVEETDEKVDVIDGLTDENICSSRSCTEECSDHSSDLQDASHPSIKCHQVSVDMEEVGKYAYMSLVAHSFFALYQYDQFHR